MTGAKTGNSVGIGPGPLDNHPAHEAGPPRHPGSWPWPYVYGRATVHWITRAACRTADPSLDFFPTEAPISPEVALCCAGCLVSEECRTYAERIGNASGVWGGILFTDGLRAR
jgi:hypothetical protein